MRVELTVREGPLEGQSFTRDLGRVVLGRSPGADGITLPGDMLVALQHGELFERAGEVVYRNLGSSPTLVNGKEASGEQVLGTGSTLALGDHHVLEVAFQPVQRQASGKPSATGDAGGESLLSSGPLAKPVVRIFLAVYGLGFLALVVFLAGSGESALTADFEETREAYLSGYAPEGVAESELESRLAEADALIVQLEIVERREDFEQARKICRQLMALDSDPSSPLYRFAAQRLGDLAGRR